jgi:hypothetical protein
MTSERQGEANWEQRLQEILHAYLEAVDAGRAPDRPALLREHPELAAELQAFFADQDRIAQIAQEMRAAEPPASAPATRDAEAPPLAPASRPPYRPGPRSVTSAITNCWRRSPAAAWAWCTGPGRCRSTAWWR